MKTKYFGDIKIDENEIITFEPGIFGFEDDTQFVLLSFLEDEELLDMELTKTTRHSVFCISVIKDNFEESTINLKCPLVINLENKKARQFVLKDSEYSMRHVIGKR